MVNNCVYFLEDSAKKFPNKVALSDKDKSYTYNQLRKSALKIAEQLQGLGRNKPVAICLPKSSTSVISFMAALYSGNFYIPLDVKNPKNRLASILEDLGPVAIITDTATEAFVKDISSTIPVQVINAESILQDTAEPAFDYQSIISRTIDTDPIYCIYTSGSTGTPKGVVVPHRGVVDYVDYGIDCYKLDENVVFGNQAQFHFDISGLDMYGAFKLGGTIHIIPENLFTFSGHLVSYLEEKEINTIYWVPSVMNHVASTDSLANKKKTYLKKILFAGEVMPNKTLNYWRKHFPEALFSNLYGPTEITITCTYYIVDRAFADTDALPIGVPCRNSNVLVLDADDKLVQVSETEKSGELCVRGSSLALGYWNDLDKTNKAFVQNPLNKNYPEKIYRTGDLVKYNDKGELLYLGRKDHQIKHMGYRIELEEIERAVLSLDPIDKACLIYDDINKHIVCNYETRDSQVDEKFLRTHLAQILPKYMIPTLYVKLQIPINSSGKIDRVFIKKNYETNYRNV